MFWWKCSGVTHQQIMACLVWLVSENLAAPRQQRHPFTHSCYLKPCQDPKAKGQSYKTGHAHITYLIFDKQWQIWGIHMHAVQTKENLCKQCVFLFYAHVQYKLQKFLAKPVFFAGLVFWFTAHVQYKYILPLSSQLPLDVPLINDEDMVWQEKHLPTFSWLPDQLIYILHSRVTCMLAN